MSVTDSTIGELAINSGGGDDVLSLQANAGDLEVRTGGGNDEVIINEASSIINANFNIGGGDDLLTLDANFEGEIIASGGAGSDSLNYIEGETINDSGFEVRTQSVNP